MNAASSSTATEVREQLPKKKRKKKAAPPPPPPPRKKSLILPAAVRVSNPNTSNDSSEVGAIMHAAQEYKKSHATPKLVLPKV